jgi:hypothetical protein
MLWAAFCVGFFGFMRSGEFTCPSLEAFSLDMLSPGDVAVDSYQNPSYVTVTLRQSKNDPFAAGVTIHLGRTGTPLCPVTALLGYLAQRPPSRGPLFISADCLGTGLYTIYGWVYRRQEWTQLLDRSSYSRNKGRAERLNDHGVRELEIYCLPALHSVTWTAIGRGIHLTRALIHDIFKFT